MLGLLWKPLQFITCVLVPLQITVETISLSKDWPFPILKTASYALQQQTEKLALHMMLLKYWSLYGIVYLILPNSPFYFVLDILPFLPLILTVCGVLAMRELVEQFIRFIQEQDKIISVMQNLNDPKASTFEMLSNLYYTTINLNNQELITTTFFFGDLTKLLLSLSKAIPFPSTTYLNQWFANIEWISNAVKMYFKEQQNAQQQYDTGNSTGTRGFYSAFWSKSGTNNCAGSGSSFRRSSSASNPAKPRPTGTKSTEISEDYDLMDDALD
ncbi:Atg40p KNAG_0B03900 [Huiozyma naganishii CBS 8797]|uniref:Uncharacterized protein n=1 Tax=Huiozyma naganishii (strain ATCC MYA-139 / BCRC 22969 / CBS 8797 / KCTC 17520 / NBRC 10181 / NCYC 3082 / Yp74L-3) TaxID=1071383 RepID=J7S4V5_HUIN7|nr:hypothetical protein KNAG_0B03900 [Kazachstania naganishii CBS 8797]CCK68831.1 hypothetical protein KNAG_0B03900 [Kazachstania naganishii CBS 8797]